MALSIDTELEERRLAVVSSQVRSVRWQIVATLAVIAALAWIHAPHAVVVVWLVAALALREWRQWHLMSVVNDKRWPVEQRLRSVAAGSALLGLSNGSAALFMWWLPPTEDALLTMILVSLGAGAIATTAPLMRAYVVYSTCLFVPTAAMWFIQGTPAAAAVGVLILMFFGVQYRFANHNAAVFEESFRIRRENDDLVRQLAAARDIAEGANRAKSRFLAAASHDLRQPLHALAMNSGLLAQDLRAHDAPQIARDMVTSIESLGELLDSLLDISKLDAGVVHVEARPIRLFRLISELGRAHRPQAETAGLRLHVECPADAVVDTDPVLLERLLRNLIDNALKYTSSGEIRIRVVRQEAEFAVSVEDTGCGIPADAQSRVFEEFYQLDNPSRDSKRGLGLGLAIVQRLTVLLALPLELRSQPGSGTVVTLRIASVEPVREESPPSIQSGPAIDFAGLRVLIVEDEEQVRQAMRNVLQRFGCTTLEAVDRASALACTCDGPPDLVIADCQLAGGDSGIQTVCELRERYPALPALLISGDTDARSIADAQSSGLPLLHKPVSFERLCAAMADAVEGNRRPLQREPREK